MSNEKGVATDVNALNAVCRLKPRLLIHFSLYISI